MSAKGGTGVFSITGEACACCGSIRGTSPGCVCTHEWGMGTGGSAADWKGKAIGGYIDPPPMKASDITQDGYYWVRQDSEWGVEFVRNGMIEWDAGAHEAVADVDYEVSGPLKPPS